MKPATLAARNTIQREAAIHVQPRLIAEWEYNRFWAPTVSVTPSQSGDDQWLTFYGDLNSMVQPFRPVAGIAKARLDDNVHPEGTYRDEPASVRYYPSYEYDIYNYWSSTQRSELVADGSGAYPFSAPIVLTTIYPQAIATNKIVVGFEKGYCLPVGLSIEVSYDGTTWDTIFVNPVVAYDGTVTIWRQGETGWDTVPAYDFPVPIKGVRVNIESVNQPYSHVDVLQISPRLENDLSDYLVKYNTQFSVSSPSFIAPMGKASSNTATVTLSNIDQRFNNFNTNSLYYGMIEKKVRFTMDLGIDTSKQGGTPGELEYIREFTMWADTWGTQDNSTVEVQLKDSSVILQEQHMPAIFLENVTIGAVVWHTLDHIGMTNYKYSRSEQDKGLLLPFYWPSDTDEKSNPRWGRLMVNTRLPLQTTIWDEFSAIAEATQTALYFDEYDVLQIVSRREMYDNGKYVNWNLDAVPNGLKLPDVVDANVDWNLTCNQVELTYKPSSYASDNNGFPQMAVVWQPTAPPDTSIVPTQNPVSTDIVLRASALVKDCLSSATELWINQTEADFWPWESDVNIEGEIIHYAGKEYTFYTTVVSGGVTTYPVASTRVNSLEDQKALDALSPEMSWKNYYTGRFYITQRGAYNSPVGDHRVSQTKGYTSVLTSDDNVVFTNLGSGTGIGAFTTQNVGYITQKSPVVPNVSHDWAGTWHIRKHPAQVIPKNNPYGTVWYGCGVRFPSGYAGGIDPSNLQATPETSTPTSNWKIGGIWFAGDWGDAGYFLEITPTAQIDGWEQRSNRHEVSLVAMPGNAADWRLTGTNGDAKGYKFGIMEDQWYAVDVSYYKRQSDGHVLIGVYINGVVVGSWDLLPSGTGAQATQQPSNYTNQWRFGTHVAGPSTVDYEYLYAVAEDDTNPMMTPDETSFMDLVTGDYASGFLARNVRYNAHWIYPNGHYPSGSPLDFSQYVYQANFVLDEYGPIVHEMRSFDVAFTASTLPVSGSFLYLTNAGKVDVMSYFSDAFGANFILANADRQTVVVHGQDQTQFVSAGGTQTVDQQILIYGRCVYTAQNDVNVVLKNEDLIRKQGLIRTQFTSRYIQTKDMADELAQWVLDLWAMGVDEVTCNLFGNPLLQVGDLVTMNFPVKGMYPASHKYFVISITNTFESGYKTQVTLRRANITLGT